jgi:beta-lactamase class A
MLIPLSSHDMFKKPHTLIIAILWTAGTVALGYCLASFVFHPPHPHERGSELRGHGTYTNPLLECDVAEDSISSRKEDFTPDLTAFIDTLKKERSGLADAAVYFRDLNNGPVIGVGQNIEFSPASLLKVPIMMAYFHRAEFEPGFLETRVTYAARSGSLPSYAMFAPLFELELGKSYTYAELIDRMIKYSDNEAMALLWDALPLSDQFDLYQLVGVDSRILSSRAATLTVKQYSIFFRVLFNASYLSESHSERALKLLSETQFDQGIRAGVPGRIPVAHKFGEREISTNLVQLHDCGVVYYPRHPYLLCIMTRGANMDTLPGAIRDISSFVYSRIDGQYQERP